MHPLSIRFAFNVVHEEKQAPVFVSLFVKPLAVAWELSIRWKTWTSTPELISSNYQSPVLTILSLLFLKLSRAESSEKGKGCFLFTGQKQSTHCIKWPMSNALGQKTNQHHLCIQHSSSKHCTGKHLWSHRQTDQCYFTSCAHCNNSSTCLLCSEFGGIVFITWGRSKTIIVGYTRPFRSNWRDANLYKSITSCLIQFLHLEN